MEFTGNYCKEDHLGKFDDFTLASPWERFISEMEATIRLWISDGPTILLEKGANSSAFLRNFYVIKSSWKYDKKSYAMEYHFEARNDGKYADWTYKLHDLQLYFGVKEFLVIAPQSPSGVILDTPEATKILSAVAVSLSNCSSLLPAFVPVHDPSRNAYIGVQSLGKLCTRRFEADRIGTQVPIKLMHLEGLYELFVSKFGIYGVDLASQSFRVGFTMKLTYQTLPHDDDDDYNEDINKGDEFNGSGNSSHNVSYKKAHWDDDCPWSEWYSAEDPIKGFKLVALWHEWTVESSLEMAEFENVSPRVAHKWIIAPNFSENINSMFDGSRVGFASQLGRLVDALKISYEAKFMEDFISVENSGSENISTKVVPPASVVDRVLKELFDEGVKGPNLRKVDGNSYMIKGAPLDSLFSQFCLQAIWFGSCEIRAVAMLWIEFVREVRWCWDQCIPLPKVAACGAIDLSMCLVHQKLQMLSECIKQKIVQNKDQQGINNRDSTHVERNSEIPDSPKNYEASNGNLKRVRASVAVSFPEASFSESDYSTYLKHMGKGSAGAAGSTMLLNSYQPMHVPFTKDPPLMTEDMHEERLQAIELFEDSANFTAQLEKDVLSSDMSAFKAANPDAVFEDFIRWHSPGDWESGSVEHKQQKFNNDWPPRGSLSRRMSVQGNLWRELWNLSPALQASEQKSLLDADREGEKILHYLETLRPNQLLEQMVCTAFRASAETLSSTDFGGMKKMIDAMGELCLASAHCLKPLQLGRTAVSHDIIEGITRLSADFDRVEKLLMLSASLHQKLVRAPRLSELLFNDYCDICQPEMRNSSCPDIEVEEVKAEVRKRERKHVEKVFLGPTKNQSWRKAMSMGNRLNGCEPALREMVFSTELASCQRLTEETHRMYIRATSNDLLVALSVTSSD